MLYVHNIDKSRNGYYTIDSTLVMFRACQSAHIRGIGHERVGHKGDTFLKGGHEGGTKHSNIMQHSGHSLNLKGLTELKL